MAKLIEVAALAGLSPATVSRYLNRSLKLPPATALRIDNAVAALGYTPNFIARSLTGHADNFIGILVPTLTNPYCAVMLSALSAEAARRGLRTLTMVSHGDRNGENEAISLLKRRNLSGLLIFSDNDTGNIVTPSADLPIVNVVEQIDAFKALPSVVMDDAAGGIAAAEHLFALGHRKTAVVTGRLTLTSARGRAIAFQERMLTLGAPCPELIFSEYTNAGGYDMALKLMKRPSPPTAIFFGADIMAMGGYRALNELGLRIPEDVSVIGFDNLPHVELFGPPLTTLKQDFSLIAKHSLDLLTTRLRRERLGEKLSVLLTPELIVRGSTGPARQD